MRASGKEFQGKRKRMEARKPSVEWTLITGASGKLGLKLTRRMIETSSHALFLHYHQNRSGLEQLLKVYQPVKRPVRLCRADLTMWSGIQRIVRQIKKLPGRIGMFVHLASLFDVSPLDELDPSRWIKMVYIHTLAPLALLRGINGRWSPEARVILMSDAGVGRGYQKYLGYTMTKSMLDSALPSLAQLLPDGVTVHGLAPYWIDEEGAGGKHSVSPEAIIDLIEWLKKHGSGCTGRLIILDGGRFIVKKR